MTTHQLANKLLEFPDVPVTSCVLDGDVVENANPQKDEEGNVCEVFLT